MNEKHVQLQQFEEEKSPGIIRKSEAVPVFLDKPTLEVEDVDFEPIIQIPSYKLCISVFFVLLGLTLLVVALVSNSKVTAKIFGVPVWAIGAAMVFAGMLGAVLVLRSLYRETQEERVQMVSPSKERQDWQI